MRLYVAGQSAYRAQFADLHKDLSREFNVISDWPFLPQILRPEEENRVWEGIDTLIASSEVVVLVPSLGPAVMCGALVEVGMALAQGARVLLVGNHASFGHWRYHSNVSEVRDMATAVSQLREWAK